MDFNNITFSSPQLQASAVNVCGLDTQCLFDVALTGSVNVGSETKNTGQNFSRQREELGSSI